MATEFTTLELALIKSSIGTRTDQEIAEILERTVPEVQSFINDVTGTTVSDRDQDVLLYKKEVEDRKKHSTKALQKARKERAEMGSVRKQREKREQEAQASWQNQRLAARAREDRSKYATRQIDLSTMHSVRVDEKTTAFYSDQELHQFCKEHGVGKAEFLQHLKAKYAKKFDKTITYLKSLR
jgi:hypothetical protein